MAFYEDDESDVAYGDCELCSKGDELSRCEVCSNRYCTDCFGGECCTGKSLCVNCVYVCKTCNDAYALKWKDVKALKDSHNIDASFCEGCAFECKSCRDTAGRPLYFCEEHAAEHNGACPGVSVAVARTAAAAHGEEKTSKALAAAQNVWRPPGPNYLLRRKQRPKRLLRTPPLRPPSRPLVAVRARQGRAQSAVLQAPGFKSSLSSRLARLYPAPVTLVQAVRAVREFSREEGPRQHRQ